MKNYYYVLSLNLTNQRIKSFIERSGIKTFNESIVDFKMRSQLYMSYGDAQSHAYDDFDKKLKVLYDDKEEHCIKSVSVINPKYALPSEGLLQAMANSFSQGNWADECCNVLFFADVASEESEITPNAWMLKYEILFSDDAIELPSNGDFAVTNNSTSSYH